MPTETAATESVSDAAEPDVVERPPRRDVRARDRRAAGAAVGLEHVAVEPERPLPERLHVGDRAERAADQPLDLDRPALLATRARLALRALPRRGREHRVLGGQPPAPVAVQPARDAVLERRRAQDPRLAERDQRRAARLLEEVGLDRERPQLVRASAARTASRRGRLQLGDRDLLDLAERELQEALAHGAESLGVARRQEPVAALARPDRSRTPCARASRPTSRAVSSAEKTSVTPRPKTRWKIGLISG